MFKRFVAVLMVLTCCGYSCLFIANNNEKPNIINITGQLLQARTATRLENNQFITNVGHPSSIFLKSLENKCTVIINKEESINFYISGDFVQKDRSDLFLKYASKSFIIWLRNDQNIFNSLHIAQTSRYWHHMSDFYVIIIDNNNIDLNMLFKTVWQFKIINVVVLQESNNDIIISTYNPFTDSSNSSCKDCMYVKSETVDLANLSVIQLNLKYFPDKFKNLRGYQLKISVVHNPPLFIINRNSSLRYTGCEGPAMYVLAKELNITYKEVVSDARHIGYILPNKSYTGLMKDLAMSKSDISFNSRYIKGYVGLSQTRHTTVGGYCFITKKSKLHPQWKNLFNTFSLNVYLYLAATVVIIFVFLSVLFHVQTQYDWFEVIVRAFLECFRVLIYSPLPYLIKSVSNRVLFLSSISLVIVINTVFVSNSASLLTTPKFYPEIDTLDDIRRSNYVIEGYPGFNPLLHSGLRNHFVNNRSDVLECPKNLRFLHNRVCLTDCVTAKYHISRLLDQKGQRYLHVGKELILYTYLAYVVAPDCVFLEKINFYIRLFDESGLYVKWFTDVIRNNDRNLDQHLPRYLTLYDLQLPFMMLIIGLTFSFVVFVIEKVMFRYFTYREPYYRFVN